MIRTWIFAGMAALGYGMLAGAATERPVGVGIEVLTDLIAGYFVVHSQWWIDNIRHML